MNTAPMPSASSPSRSAFKVKPPRRLSAWWLLLAGAVLLWNLGYAPLWTPDEGRYAASSLEMVGPFTGAEGAPAATGDWVVPHLNTIPRLNKPPLIYWLIGIAYRLFGASEVTTRLVPALAAIGVLLLVWRLGTRLIGPQAGITAGFAWATSALPFALGRACNTDMLLTFAITLAMVGIYEAIERPPDYISTLPVARQRFARWSPSIIAGIGFGLGLLTKGPVGVAMPLLIGFAYVCWTKRWRQIPWGEMAGAVALGLVIGVPWYFAVERRHPEFIVNFILRENLGRMSGAENFHDSTPFYYYLPIVVVGLLPWLPWLIAAFVPAERSVARANTPAPEDETGAKKEKSGRLFLWLWAGLIILSFSCLHTKLPTYILPAFPALALLIGVVGHDIAHRKSPRGANIVIGGTALLLAAALIGVGWFAQSRMILGRSEARGALAPLMALLTAGLVFWIVAALRKRLTLMLGQFLIACGLCVTLLPVAQRVSAHRDASGMMDWLVPQLPSKARVVLFEDFVPSAFFYLHHPATVVNFKNSSGLDEKALKNSPLFLASVPKIVARPPTQHDNRELLNQLLRDPRPTWVLLVWNKSKASKTSPLPIPDDVPHYVWACNDNSLLIANQPMKTGIPFKTLLPKNVRSLQQRGIFPTPTPNSTPAPNIP